MASVKGKRQDSKNQPPADIIYYRASILLRLRDGSWSIQKGGVHIGYAPNVEAGKRAIDAVDWSINESQF